MALEDGTGEGFLGSGIFDNDGFLVVEKKS